MRRLYSKLLLAGVTALALAACALAPRQESGANPSSPAASSLPHERDGATTGLRLAQARCSGCHAITPGQVSPNLDAPAFASIAQRPGLTQSSARSWLRQSHNFPEQMNFYLEPDQAEQLASYLLTLRDAEPQ